MKESGAAFNTAMTQAVALDVLKLGRSAFVTGPPGAGKSYLLRQFVTAARRERTVAVTASTGIAGTHIGGMTLHSWAGLGIREQYSKKDIADIADKAWVAARIRSADVLIIDEVSMLNVHTFEAANAVCRKVRRNSEPFGGMQVVLSGDFFQLPPVNKGGSIEFIYGSETWRELNPAILYLSEQFRQTDDSLLGVLGAIRDNDVTEHHYSLLQARMNAILETDVVPTRLHTHNINVDRVNATELDQLAGSIHSFEMVSTGGEKTAAALRASCLAPEKLELKEGAAVMFVKNNPADGYINGTLGTVIGFDKNKPTVRTDRGNELSVEQQNWATEDARGRKVASVEQIPLRLAWAISVHKSQGMSLPAAEIDLSRAFVEGLGYVALSRVTKMSGIRLLGLNAKALATSEIAARIDAELRNASNDVVTANSAGSEAMQLF